MRIHHQPYHTIWLSEAHKVQVIDQRLLPHRFEVKQLADTSSVVTAIADMVVRGAPLIGVTAAFGMYLASKEALQNNDPKAYLQLAAQQLRSARPTAVNLAWAVDQLESILMKLPPASWPERALELAEQLKADDIGYSEAMGENGLPLIEALTQQHPNRAINILTHCNAGWLATIDWGTATAPIYKAHRKGIPVHVWVDETRPRNQGASLTAFELGQEGVPHTVIADNTGGHLMQHGMVDLVIVGTDRTTATGDVANKIGTYLKALAAFDNQVPFYVAAPSSSIDFQLQDGLSEIPIETRDANEVKWIQGWDGDRLTKVLLTPEDSPAVNYGFDVTPARLVTGLITERGICTASEAGLRGLFPERFPND
ncbi:MAG: S-methyl-5-thioribose-1-phosphate isomerase [Salibacteraceae bacterium]